MKVACAKSLEHVGRACSRGHGRTKLRQTSEHGRAVGRIGRYRGGQPEEDTA